MKTILVLMTTLMLISTSAFAGVVKMQAMDGNGNWYWIYTGLCNDGSATADFTSESDASSACDGHGGCSAVKKKCEGSGCKAESTRQQRSR
jgi:hypothetical protein